MFNHRLLVGMVGLFCVATVWAGAEPGHESITPEDVEKISEGVKNNGVLLRKYVENTYPQSSDNAHFESVREMVKRVSGKVDDNGKSIQENSSVINSTAEKVSGIERHVNRYEGVLTYLVSWVMGILALFGGGGFISALRTNAKIKRLHEEELEDVRGIKDKAKVEINEFMREVKENIHKEVAVFQNYISLRHVLHSGNYDEDEIYNYVRQLSEKPQKEYLTAFSKLKTDRDSGSKMFSHDISVAIDKYFEGI